MVWPRWDRLAWQGHLRHRRPIGLLVLRGLIRCGGIWILLWHGSGRRGVLVLRLLLLSLWLSVAVSNRGQLLGRVHFLLQVLLHEQHAIRQPQSVRGIDQIAIGGDFKAFAQVASVYIDRKSTRLNSSHIPLSRM